MKAKQVLVLLFLAVTINAQAKCGGNIKEEVLKYVIHAPTSTETKYWVDIVVKSEWNGYRLADIDFQAVHGPEINIHLQVLDGEISGYKESMFFASKEWLAGQYCVEVDYIKNIDGKLVSSSYSKILKLPPASKVVGAK
jgi:hypothetical protein